MKLSSLDQILQKILSTLNFFDFTFVISGSATLLIIYFTITHYATIQWPESSAGTVILAIILTYICGIISFAGGKMLRLKFLRKNFESTFREIIRCENKIIEIEKYNIDPIDDSKYNKAELSQIYDKMWISLQHKPEGEYTVIYLNRSIMMQSICEGLFFSSILLGICSIIFMINSYCTYYLAILLSSIFSALIFSHEAERSAIIQIREVVCAYYKFILNS